MSIDIGFNTNRYLAHITIGIGRYTLWLNIVSTNWNKISYVRDFRDSQMGCLSIFTFALTK
jgi:hypothetical protein